MDIKKGERFSITRIANACVLMEIGNHKILTDPFFWNPAFMGINEKIALQPEELPLLSAIIGCHSIIDHWQIHTLSSYQYKDQVPVFVATRSMAKKAYEAGFHNVEVLEWNDYRSISDGLFLEVIKAHKGFGLKANNYVLSTQGLRVFFGSEARDIKPLEKYRLSNHAVDIVIAPVNGVHLFGFQKLV